MPLMTWELWLARDIVTDNPLPWHKSTVRLRSPLTLSVAEGSIAKLTSGRVAQAMGGVFAMVGTPRPSIQTPWKVEVACVRGFLRYRKATVPGWPTGEPRRRTPRYPVVKKGTKRGKNSRKSQLDALTSPPQSFQLINSALLSQFVLSLNSRDQLKMLLQRSDLVHSPVSTLGTGDQVQFVRTVNTNMVVGTVRQADGGGTTTWIKIFTDRAGNLITTYPVPAP